MSSLPETLFGQTGGGFMPDMRFGAVIAAAAADEPAARVEDPAEIAFSEGYARGYDDAMAQAQIQAQQDDTARARIETAFERLAETDELRLEQRLRETILALCEHVLAPLAADPDALMNRISKALALLRRTEDERIVRLHPDDLSLVAARLPDTMKVDPDPTLMRGELRVETTEGGLEDGPEQWRRVLSEALGI